MLRERSPFIKWGLLICFWKVSGFKGDGNGSINKSIHEKDHALLLFIVRFVMVVKLLKIHLIKAKLSQKKSLESGNVHNCDVSISSIICLILRSKSRSRWMRRRVGTHRVQNLCP